MDRRILVPALLLLVPVAALAAPQTDDPAGPIGTEPATAPVSIGEAESEAPISTAETGPVPVPEPSEKAMRYYRSGNVLWWVNVVWGLAIPALFLFTGFSARIRDWATQIGRRWFLVIGSYMVIYLGINFLIDLPLAYYQGFVRPHAYDLSNQALGKWFGDSLKGLAVGIVISVLFVWMPYLLLRKSPRRWWLYTALGFIPFLFLMQLVAPIWIAPLFNDFGPMQDQELEARILALADRAGIEGGRVFEVDMSVDTKTVNAYVAGFLNTKRIVLWDNIIEKLGADELLFVMGHEMGHYVLGHVVKSVFFIAAVVMLGLYLIYRLSGGLIRRFEHRFGFSELSDVASVPLLLALFSLFFLLLSPVMMGYSRYQEREADRFGLELTRDNRPAATAFVKLQQENLSNPRPGPLYKLWRASHPPLGERIDFCNTYRPWETGAELVYGDRFR